MIDESLPGTASFSIFALCILKIKDYVIKEHSNIRQAPRGTGADHTQQVKHLPRGILQSCP
jgi:hypothetical protein